jgi:hypothetical protein
MEYAHYLATQYKDDIKALLNDDDMFYTGYDSNYHEIAEYVKDSDDPTFRRLYALESKIDKTRIGEYTGLVKMKPKALSEEYPLLADGYGIVRKHSDHMIAYINAIYTKGN